MIKPENYDSVKAPGEYTPVALGGHYCVVKDVKEQKSSTGKDMIVIRFDFDRTDSQPGYFTEQYRADIREDKKWPFHGTKYIMVNDYSDDHKTSKNFKSFCSCIEKSNNMTIAWGVEDWGKQFKEKKIGCVYGQEESEFNGKVSMRTLPKWFCKIDEVATAAVPEPKYMKGKPVESSAASNSADIDSDLPF